MVTALESKAQLTLLGDDAEDTVRWMLRRSSGRWESRRVQLLDTVPDVLGFYSEGSAALAADFYDDARVGVAGRFSAAPVVLDRTVKIRRGVVWASEPLSADDDELAAARFAQLMRSEMARPYRDTVLSNRRRDPQAVGWMRITRGAKSCKFCRMLADRGAVYREATVRFAAHDDCMCTAAPVFRGGEVGPEASSVQYMASKRRRSPRERVFLRDYLEGNYPD
ncbi:VG15 protein [Microbacterium sp. NPDC055599]